MKPCPLLLLTLVGCISTSLFLHVFAASAESTSFTPEEVDMIKKGFLRRFGFKKQPKLATPTLPVPDHMWKIYEKAREETSEMDWIRHYYPKELLELSSRLILSYNLSAASRNAAREEVRQADLKIRLQTTRNNSRIKVYDVDQKSSQIRRLLDSKSINVNPQRVSQWINFDVTEAFVGQRENLDVATLILQLPPGVSLYSTPSHSVSALSLTRAQSAALIVYSEITEPSRVRRKRANKERKKNRKQHHRNIVESGLCQKKPLYVDFEELKWQDWILAPKGYEAGQCVGSCPHPLPAYLNGTNHAIVQALIHSLNPQIPPPCCVPTETTHLSILYMDEDNKIIIKNYPDMRVESCGCR